MVLKREALRQKWISARMKHQVLRLFKAVSSGPMGKKSILKKKRHCHDGCEETDPHTEGSLELREGAGEEAEGHSGEGRAHTDDDTRGGLRQDSGDHETSGFEETRHSRSHTSSLKWPHPDAS
ncbi:uncharacterized protein LOC144875029 isoform X1 [Branchiostoma floridae x Branchiostoma japonicum]